jgi:hypothetical protein
MPYGSCILIPLGSVEGLVGWSVGQSVGQSVGRLVHKHSLQVGWRNLFFPGVLLCQFLVGGNSFWCYLPR